MTKKEQPKKPAEPQAEMPLREQIQLRLRMLRAEETLDDVVLSETLDQLESIATAHDQQVAAKARKTTLFEVARRMVSVDGDMVLDTDWSKGYTQAVKDITKGIKAMAQGGS